MLDYPFTSIKTDGFVAEVARTLVAIGKVGRCDVRENGDDTAAFFDFHDSEVNPAKNICLAPMIGPVMIKMLTIVSKSLGELGALILNSPIPDDIDILCRRKLQV
jgi:hypothetical protein